jgi:hypothetical protein
MKKILNINIRWGRMLVFLTLGGLTGFAYYYFIGCSGTSCPITSNPYISTTYGMAIGVLLGLDNGKRKRKARE